MPPILKNRRVRLTEEQYHKLREDNGGFCLTCGDQADGIEPDAHQYTCESCGAADVYGVEELLMMGAISLVG